MKFTALIVGACLAASPLIALAAEPQDATPARSEPQAPRLTDLRAPRIEEIFTPEQISLALDHAVDPSLEYVEVHAPRLLQFHDKGDPRVEALFRGIVRAFVPYPSNVAARKNAAPDFTDPFRPIPLSMSQYSPNFPPPYSQR